jgi:hypothetical protein
MFVLLIVMHPIEESVTTQDDNKPLWRYVTVIQNNDVAGGNKLWKCNFCQREVTSSYSRVRYHLLKIPGKETINHEMFNPWCHRILC